jgi:membrane-associated phospholipid phosphatase
MDVPADRSAATGPAQVQPAPKGAVRSRPRRRPTGEAPPLPYHLQTSGVGWLVAGLVLVSLSVLVFARGLRGVAVSVTVADDAVVRWLAGLEAPGLVGVWRALAALSSWWVLNGMLVGLLAAMLVLRRWRHLIVFVILLQLLTLVVEAWIGPLAQRPRPFGVVIRTGWGGWALPSLQLAFFAAGMIVILYALVPEGRWRNTGKWIAAALVALTALGRVALGADAPTDVLVAAAIGVTLPLLAFRLFAPNEVFPVAYRQGRSAHLDVGGARGVAIRRGLEDQLGLLVEEVKPFGLAGSAGSTPLRSPSRATRPGSCSASCTPRGICAPTAGTSSAGSCSTAGWRTRSRSTPSGGWCNRRTTRCGCAATPACQVPRHTATWSSPPSGNTCWSPSSSTARWSSARPRSTTR